jgi:dTDP-4-dehydrorhamnose 3,5-epimerase
MRISETSLEGVRLVELDPFTDERGRFAELWNTGRYRAAGLDVEFVQTNVSVSGRGVLRGMHFQQPNPQGKLITVLAGTVFDAVIDVRPQSHAFGRWYGRELSAEDWTQLWVPPGFAHGFLVLSAEAIVHYSCSSLYDAAADRSLAWDDPDVGIAWPRQPTRLSAKDRAAPRLTTYARRPTDSDPSRGTRI